MDEVKNVRFHLKYLNIDAFSIIRKIIEFSERKKIDELCELCLYDNRSFREHECLKCGLWNLRESKPYP